MHGFCRPLATAFVIILPGCVEAPSLEMTTSGVQIGDIVERVKCELADSFGERIDQDDFKWMQDWTVKADLILQANSAIAANPSASYTQNFHNAYNIAAGPTTRNGSTIAAIPQSFIFGANASLGDTTNRTETISFSLSLKELKQWRATYSQTICPPPNSIGLDGNLGLGEWVNASLAPVSSRRLLAGYHPAPLTATKPTVPGLSGGVAKISATGDKDFCASDPNDDEENKASKFVDDIKKIDDDACKLVVKIIDGSPITLPGDATREQKEAFAEEQQKVEASCNRVPKDFDKNRQAYNDSLITEGQKLNKIDNDMRATLDDTKQRSSELANRVAAFYAVLIDSYKNKYRASWARFFQEMQQKGNQIYDSI